VMNRVEHVDSGMCSVVSRIGSDAA
jgi:hypothetical protein